MTPRFESARARKQAGTMIQAVRYDTVSPSTKRTQARLRPRIRKGTACSEQGDQMVYLRSPRVTENALQFREFDASYIDNLRAGDLRTQEHFVAYFTELLHLKLRSRLQSPHAIEGPAVTLGRMPLLEFRNQLGHSKLPSVKRGRVLNPIDDSE
jgi:hypothetical protein